MGTASTKKEDKEDDREEEEEKKKRRKRFHAGSLARPVLDLGPFSFRPLPEHRAIRRRLQASSASITNVALRSNCSMPPGPRPG